MRYQRHKFPNCPPYQRSASNNNIPFELDVTWGMYSISFSLGIRFSITFFFQAWWPKRTQEICFNNIDYIINITLGKGSLTNVYCGRKFCRFFLKLCFIMQTTDLNCRTWHGDFIVVNICQRLQRFITTDKHLYMYILIWSMVYLLFKQKLHSFDI